MKPYGIIYRHTNLVNDKRYVGQTIQDPQKRWKQHVYNSKNTNSNTYNNPLQQAIRKYGEKSFILEILSECETQEDLDADEKYFADLLNAWSPNGYTLRAGKGRGSVGDETRKKQSGENNHMFGKRFFGKDNPNFGKHALAGENHFMFGKHHSAESRAKNAESNKGKRAGEKHSNFGKHLSTEVKDKIAESRSTKVYYFISPFGESVSIVNIRKFCRENEQGLHNVSMYKVIDGKQKSYKGWTRDESYYLP